MSAGRTLASEWVMRLDVRCAEPVMVGQLDAGVRINYPIVGGRFEGKGLSGEVLPGVDHFLQRSDGIGTLDARYSLRTDDGVVINVHNRGLLWVQPDPGGKEPAADAPYRCHCTPVFEAPHGAYIWLNQGLFAGRIVYPDLGRVVIDVYSIG